MEDNEDYNSSIPGQYPKADRKGGFRKIDEGCSKYGNCQHPDHKPPSHIVLEPGRYEYTCPACGKVTIVNIPEITC